MGYTFSMKFLYYLGLMLLILAFTAGAADVIPRNFERGGGNGFVSAYDLIYAIWPGKLVIAQIHIERFSPILWDPILIGFLTFPAWLLLGLPGGLLAWFYRPNKVLSPEIEESIRRQEENLQLYDKLVQDAQEAGFGDEEFNQGPNLESHEIIDFNHVTSDPDLSNVSLDSDINSVDWKNS
jgi:hypothetical protein